MDELLEDPEDADDLDDPDPVAAGGGGQLIAGQAKRRQIIAEYFT